MIAHYPVMIVVVPLLSAFIIAGAGWFDRRVCYPLALAAMSASLYFAAVCLAGVLTDGVPVYRLGGWAPPWGIAYKIDHLNGLVLVVVAAVAWINLLATHQSVRQDFRDKIAPFYALYVLFVAGLLGMVVTGDAFNLYVLLEIASLTGYALLGMGSDRAPLSSLNYIFMGTIGASFYLLGIGYLYLATGSLNMADIAALLAGQYQSKVVLMAFVICLTGLFIKMALVPLHMWLPNAYADAPSPAVSLIAPLTTKVMVYVMVRICLNVFTPAFTFSAVSFGRPLVWLAVLAIVTASVMALSQKTIKRMLAYIVIAEVGYMVGGLWLGNRYGITGTVLHIVNDAAMTLCVFLAAGSIVFRLGNDRLASLQGVFRKMPFSMAALVVGALSIIGVPPTCGFFSKWYLILGGIQAGQYGFVAALLFSSLVNIVLFFRIFEIGFFEPFSRHHDEPQATVAESPPAMLASLMFVALLLIVLGIYTNEIVEKIIRFAVPPGIA